MIHCVRIIKFDSSFFICINLLILVGKNNRYGHLIKDVLSNLEDSRIYRIDQDGSIVLVGNYKRLALLHL